MTFNLQDAVKNIYDMKVGWHTSDKAGDRAKANEYAENAKQYYQQLIDNGYEDVANVLKNTNDVGAKSYYDNLMKNYSAPTVTTSKSNTPTATADITTAGGMATDMYGVQRADKETVSKKYDTLEEYAYGNPFERDEGKSIMANYKFQGETARDNAMASGGASNGGNIDSYAAANANRQQLAYTNAGTQAVLNANSEKINLLRGILNDMGVNLQNLYGSMQTTIGLKQSDEQRQFENGETAKNNDVDRNVKVSEVTGYVPEKWSNANNFYLDENGNLKPEYENVDFSAVMAEAKKNGNTELYDQASLARAKKIYGNYAKYGKYDDGNYALPSKQQTESGRRFDKEIDTSKAISDNTLATEERMNSDNNATSKYTSDNNLEATRDTNATSERISDKTNAANITISQNEKIAKAEENPNWREELSEYDLSDNARAVLALEAYNSWARGEVLDDAKVKEFLLKYKDKLTWNDVVNIATMYGFITDDNADDNAEVDFKTWINSQSWYDPKAKSSDYDPTK